MLGMKIPANSELHGKIMTALWNRYQLSQRKMSELHDRWQKAEEQTIAWVPETEDDKKNREKRRLGKPAYTTISVPYSYALLMTAHTYATSTLFGRDPVFQYLLTNGRNRQKEQAIEALVAYNVRKGKHLVPYYAWVYDAFKYGIGILGNYWAREESVVPQIIDTPQGKQKVSARLLKYQGNKVYNIRPYHFFPDTRKPLHRFQEGEFCAVYFELGWNEISRRAARGEYFNLEELRYRSAEGYSTASFSTVMSDAGSPAVPIVKPDPLMPVQSPFSSSISSVGLIEMVVELSPKEWGLGESDYPEKWMFTFDVKGRVIIGCRPLGYLHDRYPYNILTLEPEVYMLLGRTLMDIVRPLQDVMDWLVNTHFFNIRSILNNTLVVDPSRVVLEDLLSGEPGGIWRLSPSAYGTDVRTAVSQMNVADVTQTHIADMKIISDLMQRTTGIMDNIMGMPMQGGRKSATEVRQSGNFSIGRMKTVIEWFSALGIDEHSQMMLANCQQFYDGEMQLRIAGDLLGQMQYTQVTPEQIMGEYDFVPIDGAMPVDRYAQANLLRQMLMEGTQAPMLLQGFDIPGLFTYIMQLSGIKNINQFRVQVMPPGMSPPANSVGVSPAQSQGSFNPEALQEVGQLIGMGQTA